MRLSLSYLALRIKILKVDLGSSIEDVLSRALDPPTSANIQRAVSALVEVCLITAHLLLDTHNLKPIVAGWCPDI
jgi:ATP-dependent RNA helicase DHX29